MVVPLLQEVFCFTSLQVKAYCTTVVAFPTGILLDIVDDLESFVC